MARTTQVLPILLCVLLVSGCQDTSSAHDHEVAAAYDEAAAEAHARASAAACSDESSSAESCLESEQTAHAASADGHRMAAEDHRQRARVLREAESGACRGVDGVEATLGPFFNREEITRVSVVAAPSADGTPLGATAFLRPSKGLTRDGLERLVDCHLARNVSQGLDAAQMESCPLVLPGVQAEVGNGPRGLSVTVTSADPAIAREIVTRMITLRDGAGS